jgi:hypothetical protein
MQCGIRSASKAEKNVIGHERTMRKRYWAIKTSKAVLKYYYGLIKWKLFGDNFLLMAITGWPTVVLT